MSRVLSLPKASFRANEIDSFYVGAFPEVFAGCRHEFDAEGFLDDCMATGFDELHRMLEDDHIAGAGRGVPLFPNFGVKAKDLPMMKVTSNKCVLFTSCLMDSPDSYSSSQMFSRSL